MPNFKPVSTHGGDIDQYFKPRLGDFCVVTGIPSHGKSALLTSDVISHTITVGRRRLPLSSKTPTWPPTKSAPVEKRKLIGKQTPEQIESAEKWIDEILFHSPQTRDDDVNLDWVLEKSSVSVIRHDCKVIVIDLGMKWTTTAQMTWAWLSTQDLQ